MKEIVKLEKAIQEQVNVIFLLFVELRRNLS